LKWQNLAEDLCKSVILTIESTLSSSYFNLHIPLHIHLYVTINQSRCYTILGRVELGTPNVEVFISKIERRLHVDLFFHFLSELLIIK